MIHLPVVEVIQETLFAAIRFDSNFRLSALIMSVSNIPCMAEMMGLHGRKQDTNNV